MTKYGAAPAGKAKSALRQTGEFEWHPDECECRKCRRRAAALARRLAREDRRDRAMTSAEYEAARIEGAEQP